MDSLTHSHSKQYTFIHITVTVWKLGLQYSRFPKYKRWKKKKKKEEEKRKEKKRGEGSRNPGQGRLGFGPTWFWADLVLGRVGFGPTWFGPSWFWAELTRERNCYLLKRRPHTLATSTVQVVISYRPDCRAWRLSSPGKRLVVLVFCSPISSPNSPAK